MSSPTLTHSPSTPEAAEISQAENIRNAMSFNNLLADPVPTTPDVTSNVPALDPPCTPTKVDEAMNEQSGSPDSVLSDAPDADIGNTAEDAEDVPDDQREFICINDEHGRCQTGQYTKELSRKVISDHFGRNKACTRDIPDWPLFCRKHYQRATYDKPKWQIRKVQLILRQFDIIEVQYPGTTYDVAYKKSEETRMNQYSRHVAASMSEEDAAKNVAPVSGKHFEAPIDVLRELDQYTGRGKTLDDVKKAVDVILQMLEEHDTEQVPAIEFLPQLPGKQSPKKTPTKARATKSPKTPRTPKTPSHLSAKGSVKKTQKS